MGTIVQTVRRFERFDVFETAMVVLEDSKKEVLKINKGQLTKGRRKTGKKIGNTRNRRYKSARYARYKNRKNSKAGLGNPDLILTGDFTDDFRFKRLSKKEYDIDSNDSKAAMLEEKYGSTIYGMSDENAGDFVNRSYGKKYINRARRQLGVR